MNQLMTHKRKEKSEEFLEKNLKELLKKQIQLPKKTLNIKMIQILIMDQFMILVIILLELEKLIKD